MAERRLRILLISPSASNFINDSEFDEYVRTSRDIRTILHFWSGIGLGLPTIAALTPETHDVRIIDENKESIPSERDFDIVGITAMTHQADRAYKIAADFRRRGCYVVMGGIHATVCPQEAISNTDSVFVGEAENMWQAFLSDFLQGSPKRIYNHSDYGPVEMCNSPVPKYALLSKYSYPVVFVQTTRGCPHDCEFCVASNVYGKRYKRKPISQVVEEILEIKKYWKRAQIGFADDNMFVNRRYSRALVERFKELVFSWFAVCDVSVAQDEELLRAMHDSGCRTLLIGFESVREDNLQGVNENMWKAKQLAHYKAYIHRIQKQGIGVYASFILGFENDTPQTVGEIIDFVNSNNLIGGHATILTPLPGSRLRARLAGEGKILDRGWKWYTLWNAVIKHENFSPDELERGVMTIFKGIYNPESNKRRSEHFKRIYGELIQV
jgi:radical SAM superfamily enzyme YgiQ (UPF0313 family)